MWLWPMPTIFSRLLDFLFGYVILLVLFGAFEELNISLVWLVPAIAAQIFLMTALLYILTPIVLLIPDVSRLVSLTLRIGFFVTPVLYETVNVPSYIAPWLRFNPLTHVLDFYRHALFGSPVSSESIVWFFGTSGALFVFGIVLFRFLYRKTLKEIYR